VLLVDDHLVVREGVAAILARQGMKIVADAADGASALIAYRAHKPDVTLMDLRLPDMSGADVIRELKRDYPEARFVVLTTFYTTHDSMRAFSAGASAYLLKDCSGVELVSTVRAVRDGAVFMPVDVRERLDGARRQIDLSAREREVVRLLADGRANKEIAASLGISRETVKTYIERMRAKVEAPDRAALVAKAIKLGLMEA
jgi:DNA-binding NarL/FixJ family response regulator